MTPLYLRICVYSSRHQLYNQPEVIQTLFGWLFFSAHGQQKAYPKRRCPSTKLHDVTYKNNVTLIFREIILKGKVVWTRSQYSDSLRAGWSGDRFPVGGGARFSEPVQTDSVVHPASYMMGTASFPGVRGGRGVALTTHPHLAPRLKKE